MEYNDILQKVEEQKNERNIAGKMFRYSGLILAVDFFSQKLNPDQIIEAAFDFVNELLSLEDSAIYFLKEDVYKLKRFKGREWDLKIIKNNDTFKNFAVHHGNLLTGNEILTRFFENKIIDTYKICIAVPVIVDSSLEGFILIPERSTGKFDDDDYIICEVLMKLFNNAMENYKRYNELQITNTSLDEKIFNLFAINQSSKALLSELELDSLYSLSISVFSELTQSSVTGFVLYDEKSECHTLKAYRFIYNQPAELHMDFYLRKDAIINANKIIINLESEQDRDYLNSLFENGTETLRELSPQYVVLLTKGDAILGFVTLSASVNGTSYKASVFELIESLASSTYISISNAKLFKQVIEQKTLIQNKLERLISLNNLIKNINSSSTVETLLDITVRTLNISFGVQKCLIALYDDEKKHFNIKKVLSTGVVNSKIQTNRNWHKVSTGGTEFVFGEKGLSRFFEQDILDGLGDITEALIIPIYQDKSDIDLLGILVVFKFKESIISEEENVLLLENIANHIAPILGNLVIIEEQKKNLLPNYVELFKNELMQEISRAEEYLLELCVLKVTDSSEFEFGCDSLANKLKGLCQKTYPFSHNTVYMLVNNAAPDIEDNIRALAGVVNPKVKKYIYGKDFNTYEQFFTAKPAAF